MSNLSLLLAFAALSLAGMQPLAAQSPVSTAPRSPITVQLMTVLDNPDIVGGQRVRVPAVGVRQAIGPRLVVVTEPRLLGVDRSYQPDFRFDRMLVVLPADVAFSRDQVITVTGEVRTLVAARAAGLQVDQRALADSKWAARALVLMADSVETLDGVPLTGSGRQPR